MTLKEKVRFECASANVEPWYTKDDIDAAVEELKVFIRRNSDLNPFRKPISVIDADQLLRKVNDLFGTEEGK